MTGSLSAADRRFFSRAVELALATEARGNLPIGAVVTLDGEIVAEGANEIFHPAAHPGRHAEVMALAAIPQAAIHRAPEMTCYTTLEPCLMCFGSLVLHRVGRVVFGAADPFGGAVGLADRLPPYVARQARDICWEGPAAPGVCEPLFRRAFERYRESVDRLVDGDAG